MKYLKQGTATAVIIGPFIDDTDGKTPEDALTVTSMDADIYYKSDTHPLTKTDLTITASGGSNDCAHVANGYYSLELTSTNTGTEGRLLLTINISGALPVWHEFEVLPQNIYDSLVDDGTDKLQVDATQWDGTNVASPHTAGYPAVTIKDGTGTGELDTSSGFVQILMSQATDGGTANSVGEALRNAHEGIPNAAAGGLNGLPTVNASNYVAGVQGTKNTLDDLTDVSDAEVWAYATRVLTAATNLTSTGNAVELHTDDRVLLAGTTHTSAVVPTTTAVTNSVNVGQWNGTAVTLSSTTNKPEVDIYSVSDDATAANNAELDYDGTGYDKANSTIGTVGALDTQAKADVNAEVSDVLKTDTIAELTGDPGTTPTFEDAVMLLYMALRNQQTSTSSAATIANNAGSSILTSTLSDNGTTFTKGKYA